MSDSDSSSLSTPPATDDEMPEPIAPSAAAKTTPQKKKKSKKNGNILTFFKNKSPSPVRKKRPASPPHEYVPEDNPDIAFIVMFRSRFTEAFPPKSPNVGPQDIERGVADELPSPQIESLLCAILGLVLNRKKPVERGHYGRALEEAIQTQRSQWPREWNGTNPLNGGRSFNTMSATERIVLLKTLALWGLASCDAVKKIINDTYKARTNKIKDDSNIPLSIQPWGRDGDNRRYWLIEGQDDTPFRVYRESNPKLKNVSWWSVAGSIEEIRALAQKLKEEDGAREAKQLGDRMLNAIPRFEATEEKIKKRQYRQQLKSRWQRPEPGFSMYEGRTRGKRMKYTFSDDEDNSEALDLRRSTRNSGRDTPGQQTGPTVTASGRQVKSRAAGAYGESLVSGQTTERASPATGDYVRSEGSMEAENGLGRPTRNSTNRPVNGWSKGRGNIETYNSVDEMDDEDDATSWDGGDEEDEEPDQMDLDDEDDDLEDEAAGEDEDGPKTLLVRLKYPKGSFESAEPLPTVEEPPAPPKADDETPAVPRSPAKAAPLESAPAAVPANAAPVPTQQPTELAEPAVTEQPAAAPPAPAHSQSTHGAATNGWSAPSAQNNNGLTTLPPITESVNLPSQPQGPQPVHPAKAVELPPISSAFSAPTPPYAAAEEKAQQYPVSKPTEQHPPFQPQAVQHPTPASTWQ